MVFSPTQVSKVKFIYKAQHHMLHICRNWPYNLYTICTQVLINQQIALYPVIVLLQFTTVIDCMRATI